MSILQTLISMRDKADTSLLRATENLATVQANNATHNRYLHNLAVASQTYDELLEYKGLLELERDVLNLRADLHEQVILNTIEKLATQKLRILRPEDRYVLKLESRVVESYRYVHVLIKHELETDDEFVPVKADVGKFVKQLIATSICLTTAKLMGHKEIFMDEPVSNGSATSLKRLQSILNAYTLTYYMIDQKPEMYNLLQRREFHMRKLEDDYRGYTVVERVVDYEGSESLGIEHS